MMRKIALWLLMLMPLVAEAAEVRIGDFYYNLSSGEAVLTKPYSVGSKVSIPSSVTYEGKTYAVTGIGQSAFYNYTSITSVSIPSSVKSIGTAAFMGCWGLASMSLPNNIKTLSSNVFNNCRALSSLTIPSSVTEIGSGAFVNCYGLSSLTIPSNVTTIRDGAFKGCNGLKTLKLQNGVKYIYGSAFSGCYRLTSVTIPGSVESMGEGVFDECTSVKELIYAEGCTTAFRTGLTKVERVSLPKTLTAIGDKAFSGFTQLLNSFVVPNKVTSIGEEAFKGCTGLTSVTIPGSVESIGQSAFAGCDYVKELTYASGCTTALRTYLTSIESVSLPSTLTSIGECAFYNCKKLTQVTIPSAVMSVGDDAFYGCSSLPVTSDVRYADTYLVGAVEKSRSSYAIKSGTRFIGNKAFADCTSLTAAVIPDGTVAVGTEAYARCYKLASVTIGSTVVSMGRKAFTGCNNIKTMNITFTDNEAFATYIPRTDLKQVFHCTEGSYSPKVVLKINGKTQYTVTVPEGVTSIGAYAFCDCNSVTSVNIPTSVKSIGKYAFSSVGMGEVVIPTGVTTIDEYAFLACGNMTSATIGKSVTKMGYRSFGSCSNLKSVTSLATTPPTISAETFAIYDKLHVLKGLKGTYQGTQYWNRFTIDENADDPDKEVEVSTIELNVTSLTLKEGGSAQLTATIYPNNATDKSVNWTSDNESVATVSSNGQVTAKKAGTANITCTATNGVRATCAVKVESKPAGITVSLSSAGYATFYSSESAYTLPNGLRAMVVAGYDEGKLSYLTIAQTSWGGVIPKGVAVVLANEEKRAATYTLESSESTNSYSGVNYLHGSDVATTTSASGNNVYYKLTFGDTNDTRNQFGWYWGASAGAAFKIEAHKAWLALPKSATSRGVIRLGEETQVDILPSDKAQGEIYDLQGRRVTSPTVSGLYIVNGKKVLIKK